VGGVADAFARWRAAQAGPAPAPRAPSPPAPAAPAPPQAAVPPVPDAVPTPGQAGTVLAPSPGQVGWLGSIARAVRAALADGAVRVADEAGGLALVRPDGRHLARISHHQPHAASLMP
jgi:hypothetical protein